MTTPLAEILNGPESNAKKNQKVKHLLAGFKGKLGSLTKSIETIMKESSDEMGTYCTVYGIKPEDSELGRRLLGASPSDTEDQAEEAWKSFSVADSFCDTEETVESIFAKGVQDVTQAISENFSIDGVFRIILESIYRGVRMLGARRTYSS